MGRSFWSTFTATVLSGVGWTLMAGSSTYAMEIICKIEGTHATERCMWLKLLEELKHPKQLNLLRHFSQVPMTFSRIDCNLGHKLSLNNFERYVSYKVSSPVTLDELRN